MEPEEQNVEVAKSVPMRRRVRVWTILIAFCLIWVAMAVGSGYFSIKALHVRHDSGELVKDIFYALALCIFPASLVWTMVRRRWKTGRWGMSEEERLRMRTQCARKGQRDVVANPWVAAVNIVRWGRYAAFDKSATVAKRVCGWFLVTMWIGFVVGTVGIVLMCCGATFADDNTAGQMIGFLVFGLLVAIYPYVWIRRCIRRRKETGFAIKLPAEEMDVMRESWRAWRVEQYSKSTSQKLKTLLGLGVTLVIWSIAAHYLRNQYFLLTMFAVWSAYLAIAMFNEPTSERADK